MWFDDVGKGRQFFAFARGKEIFFVKMLAEWGNVCIFAAREPAKPLCNA